VVFNLLVVLLEFCAADTLLKFNINVNPSSKSIANNNFFLILKAPNW
jgi:hypothetical protein